MRNLGKIVRISIITVLILLVFSLSKIIGLYTDYLWFLSLGFEKIFIISLISKFTLFFAASIFFFIFASLNIWIASRLQQSKFSFKIALLIILLISFFQGISATGMWLSYLRYMNQVPFNLQDPIFSMDAGFYVFSLPFFLFVWRFLFSILIITSVIVILYYLEQFLSSIFSQRVDPNTNVVYKPFNFTKEFSKIKRSAMVHVAILGSFVFILLSLKHYLERYSVMYSESGIVVGAGYTDVNVFLPVVKFLMIFSLFIAALFYIWILFYSKKSRFTKRHFILLAFVLYAVVTIGGGVIVPGIVQSLKVSPNEINLESQFIENNIEFTKIAYGLDEIEERDFDVRQDINYDTLKREKETIDNVRILDWRPLTQTYKQTQEIRLYYDLSGIDIDRYKIDGKYTEVMLALRELDQNQIADNAKTWVNLHMVYTHGFGLVMSPINTITDQGLPNYLIKDVPPSYSVDKTNLQIEESRIYYGELDNDYVLVNTLTKEFDFPKGNTNEYISYDGKGGVILDTFLKKLAMAIRFADIKILLSSDITPESKIMFDRNIKDRVSKIMPFLVLDKDPYSVIADGKILWIQDAYTVTENFPYSQKYGRINYIRNSVKIVVDAYNGDVTFYVIDKEDPIIRTYAKIFPKQFKDFNSMPASLKEHIRYPEELFKAQASIFNTYHMDDVTVFYNKEDAWEIPHEIYGTGQQTEVEPYYIIMKLPGEEEEEFVLMTTFTPIKKDNMIAWMAARSDNENYGKLLLFKFPKDKLVYGPLQIEARIDQDSEISQQLTLWSQQGSRVTRGNLLVIPIENSLLYIEPLYIQAEQGQLPELKRVLVSDGEKVVMEETLADALDELFKGQKKVKDKVEREESSSEDLLKEANNRYADILDAMDRGDWNDFGDNFNSLGEILEELNK